MAKLDYHDITRLLKADFETGKLYWLPRTPDMFDNGIRTAKHSCAWWNSRFANAEAFTAVRHGYRHGLINRKAYSAHRVLWLLYSGNWPEDQVDHINGNRGDNRIVNLRSVSRAENMKNKRERVDNTSGVTGVSLHRKVDKWHAYICVDGRIKSLGYFDDKSAAVSVRKKAEQELGYHQNHGRT